MNNNNSTKIWLGLAFLLCASVLFDSLSTFSGGGLAALTRTEILIEALPLVFIAGGFGILLYTAFKFRLYSTSPAISQQTHVTVEADLSENDIADPQAPPSKTLFYTVHPNNAYIESFNALDKELNSIGPEPTLVDSDILSVDSELLSEDSQLEPPEPEHDLDIENTPQILSTADPMSEAKILLIYGKSYQAIELLLEYFDQLGSDQDEIALELVTIVEREIHKEDITAEQLTKFNSLRNDILFKLEDKKGKLSKSSWKFIQNFYANKIESLIVHHSESPPHQGAKITEHHFRH